MNIVLAASVAQYKKWINDNKLDPFEYKYLDKSVDGKDITKLYFVPDWWRCCKSCEESKYMGGDFKGIPVK